jgi:hypothetical protein
MCPSSINELDHLVACLLESGLQAMAIENTVRIASTGL